MNTIDITKLSDTEIKALAYEQISAIEQAQNNLRVCNEELNKRVQPKEEVKDEKPKKK